MTQQDAEAAADDAGGLPDDPYKKLNKAPKKSRREVRSAVLGRMSTLCEISCWPPPLIGSSLSEQRAKLTGMS